MSPWSRPWKRAEKVNAFVVPYYTDDPTQTRTAKLSDTAATIICRMDNGAVLKSLHGSLRGHGNYVRIHDNRGLMVYSPDFPVHHERATQAGHGGGERLVRMKGVIADQSRSRWHGTRSGSPTHRRRRRNRPRFVT